MRHVNIICGNALTVLQGLADQSVQCCITSPPFFSTLDFTITGQLGMEATPGQYIQRLVKIFHEVQRTLDTKGALFLNLPDTALSQDVAQALGRDRWYIQAMIPWVKPERPNELIFLFTVLEDAGWYAALEKETVWTLPAGRVFSGNYASFPIQLPTRCLSLAQLPPNSTILDPFSGAGTTGVAATRLGHNAILIDINSPSVELSQGRILVDDPYANDVQVVYKEQP